MSRVTCDDYYRKKYGVQCRAQARTLTVISSAVLMMECQPQSTVCLVWLLCWIGRFLYTFSRESVQLVTSILTHGTSEQARHSLCRMALCFVGAINHSQMFVTDYTLQCRSFQDQPAAAPRRLVVDGMVAGHRANTRAGKQIRNVLMYPPPFIGAAH